MYRSFVVSEEAILKTAQLFMLFCHCFSHFLKKSLLKWAFPMLFKKRNSIWVVVYLVSIFQSFPFLFFTFCHLIGSLIATSKSSFPSISIWAETYESSKLIFLSRSVLIHLTINLNICCFDDLSEFSMQQRILWLLVKIVPWLIYKWAIWDMIIFGPIIIFYRSPK